MRRMRIRAVLLAWLFLLVPIPVAADFVSMGPSSICPKGTAGDPSGPPKSFSLSSPPEEIRNYLNRRVLCPSACFNEAVTLNVAVTGITVTVAAQNKCTKTKEDPQAQDAKKDNRGCAKGKTEQTHPRVVVKITGLKEQVIPAKSRCDVSNLTQVINSVAEQKLGEALAGLETMAQPIVGTAVPAPLNLGTPAGQKILAEQLATAFQTTPEKAEAIVAKDPQAALRAIYAVSGGNEAAIKAEAEALGLNANLADTVTLRAKLIKDGNLMESDPTTVPGTAPDTFQETARIAIVDTLAPLCGQLGGCSDTACLSNPGSLTCRTNNPGALTWSAWEAKYGGQPCGESNNTTCFPSIEHGLAAKVALLTGPKYFGGENNTILSAICNAYATNAAGNNCAAYATFIQNQTGIPMNQTVDSRNPEQMGKIMMAISRYENGKMVPFTPQQLQAAMSLVYGGTLPNGTPGFIPSTVYGTNLGNQFNSPFNVNSTGVPATVGYGSAFANTSPTSYSQPSYSPAPVNPVSQTIPQPVTPPRVPITSSSSTVAQELIDALQGDSTTRGSTMTIRVQPETVARGNPVTVSWSVSSMSTQKPCVVRAGATLIAQKNEGSSVVPTGPSTRLGSLVFSLVCTTPSGAVIQRTAATFVE